MSHQYLHFLFWPQWCFVRFIFLIYRVCMIVMIMKMEWLLLWIYWIYFYFQFNMWDSGSEQLWESAWKIFSISLLHQSSGNGFQQQTFSFLYVPEMSPWLSYSSSWLTNSSSTTFSKHHTRRLSLQKLLSKYQAPICNPWPIFFLIIIRLWFVDVGTLSWQEHGSVVYSCCWATLAQFFSHLMTIFYCPKFEKVISIIFTYNKHCGK
jgi:hypothetical protein